MSGKKCGYLGCKTYVRKAIDSHKGKAEGEKDITNLGLKGLELKVRDYTIYYMYI